MLILFSILTISFLANLFCLFFTMMGRPLIDETLGCDWALGNVIGLWVILFSLCY